MQVAATFVLVTISCCDFCIVYVICVVSGFWLTTICLKTEQS